MHPSCRLLSIRDEALLKDFDVPSHDTIIARQPGAASNHVDVVDLPEMTTFEKVIDESIKCNKGRIILKHGVSDCYSHRSLFLFMRPLCLSDGLDLFEVLRKHACRPIRDLAVCMDDYFFDPTSWPSGIIYPIEFHASG